MKREKSEKSEKSAQVIDTAYKLVSLGMREKARGKLMEFGAHPFPRSLLRDNRDISYEMISTGCCIISLFSLFSRRVEEAP